MSGPNGEPHVPVGGAGGNDDNDDNDGDSFGEEEYAAINSMLDQINSCLDHLEEKNDYLHACLKELLESNRQTRLEFQQQSEQQNMEADAQGSQPPA
ncbi:bublin coiled-coil protein [Theristicus caerulescens]